MDNASGTHGTDYRSPAPFRATVSRRRFLQVGGALAGAAAVGRGQPADGLGGRRRAARPHRDDRRPEARGDPHAGEPVLRPLLRHPAGRARLLRQAGPQVPERQRRSSSSPTAARTDLGYLLPVPHGLHQGGRAERRATSTTAGPATTARATAGCGTTGSPPRPSRRWATSPARPAVQLRAGRRVHHLRRLPPVDTRADQPEPDVLLDGHARPAGRPTRLTTPSSSRTSPPTRSCC